MASYMDLQAELLEEKYHKNKIKYKQLTNLMSDAKPLNLLYANVGRDYENIGDEHINKDIAYCNNPNTQMDESSFAIRAGPLQNQGALL